MLDEQEQVGQGLFQSLFYWILFLRVWNLDMYLYCGLVSILVLLDFVLKDWPCVMAMSLQRVSILVLLDFVLKEEVKKTLNIEKNSFNPCFIGFCS